MLSPWPLAGRPTSAAGTAARRLLPSGFQRAACAGSGDLAEQEGPLPAPLRGQRGNAPPSRGRSQASRSRDRLLEYPAHLGTDLATASTHSLRCAGWRVVFGTPTVDTVAAAILLAGQSLEPCLSRQVRSQPQARLSREGACLLWPVSSAGSGTGVPHRCSTFRFTSNPRARLCRQPWTCRHASSRRDSTTGRQLSNRTSTRRLN
jgi:hypothetical protein